MKELIKNAELLRLIYKAPPSVQREILYLLDKKLVRLLCEISKNTLRGTLKLNNKQLNKLKNYKSELRHLSRKGDTWKQKKKRIVQCGSGFISALLGPILGILLKQVLQK